MRMLSNLVIARAAGIGADTLRVQDKTASRLLTQPGPVQVRKLCSQRAQISAKRHIAARGLQINRLLHCSRSQRRNYTSSSTSKMAHLSSAQSVKNALESYGHTKWGFVIYRTSYSPASDNLWARFQTILQERAQTLISASDAPELINSLEYKFVSDSKRLADVDVPTLREIHAEWRSSPDAQAEQPEGSEPVWPSDIPRYKHCVCADEESMMSVVEGVQPPEIDWNGKSFVKFLHCDWRGRDDDETDEEAAEREQESWMLMASWMLVTDAYDIFHDENINWYTFWKAPPRVVNH